MGITQTSINLEKQRRRSQARRAEDNGMNKIFITQTFAPDVKLYNEYKWYHLLQSFLGDMLSIEEDEIPWIVCIITDALRLRRD